MCVLSSSEGITGCVMLFLPMVSTYTADNVFFTRRQKMLYIMVVNILVFVSVSVLCKNGRKKSVVLFTNSENAVLFRFCNFSTHYLGATSYTDYLNYRLSYRMYILLIISRIMQLMYILMFNDMVQS